MHHRRQHNNVDAELASKSSPIEHHQQIVIMELLSAVVGADQAVDKPVLINVPLSRATTG
jgi:hypothetical protein